jgi:AcrR family transcriptional regulator
MRPASTKLKADRRTEILDAAQTCFARSGFHQASMQEICAEANMSPGNLYRYFPSKEAIIAGICERDRAEAAESFNAAREAPDFFSGLAELARFHLIERTAEEIGLCAEIMAESRRNPEVARVYQIFERDIKDRLTAMLRHGVDHGEIRNDLDIDTAAAVLLVIADGISWRRAVDAEFDPEKILPVTLQMVACLLGKPSPSSETSR